MATSAFLCAIALKARRQKNSKLATSQWQGIGQEGEGPFIYHILQEIDGHFGFYEKEANRDSATEVRGQKVQSETTECDQREKNANYTFTGQRLWSETTEYTERPKKCVLRPRNAIRGQIRR